MLNPRPIGFVMSVFLLALSVAMLIPALADALAHHPDWQVFLTSAAFTFSVGVMLFLASRGGSLEFGLREGFVLTTGSWVVLSAFGALPFLFSNLRLDYADAFFEAISGLTTTGSTVLVGLDAMPPGILLWRGLLQWIGGIGIIVMGVAVLPFLRVGGMQLFRTESSDRSDKILPRPGQIAAMIGMIYLGLTVACGVLYALAGMSRLEAMVHAMTTVSTGGYSTSDASIGHFGQPSVHWIATLFMLLGALPFVLYARVLLGRRGGLWRDSQVRALVVALGAAILVLTAWLTLVMRMPLLDALRLAAFNVTSIATTTGYATADYGLWGSLAVLIFFLLTFMGGCTGSTAGGIKIFRLEILASAVRRQLTRLHYPHAVIPSSYNGRELTEDVGKSVVSFVAAYIAGFCALALALAAIGLDPLTSASGAATAIGNVGPGLGPIIGPAGNFSILPDSAKWVLSLGMLLGRLEVFAVLVLLMPGFWRR